MPSLCHARFGPTPPPPHRDHRAPMPYAHAHPHRHSLQPIPPMVMMRMPPPPSHFHYSPYGPPGPGPSPGPDSSGIMYGPPPHHADNMMTPPSADAETRHAEAVHRWHYEHAAGTGAMKTEEKQGVERNDKQVKEEATQHGQEHESGCKSSPSQDDMYENALLLASLAKSPGKDNSHPCLDRRDLDGNDDSLDEPPPQPQPQEDQVGAIPKPNIVTPVSSERQFVEELHHDQRVDLSPPNQSFYQQQGRGASQSSIFRTPQKKRGRAEDTSNTSSKSQKKTRSVYGQHPAYPRPNRSFVSPGPPLPFSNESAEYPPAPYPYPYPHNLPPRFGSGRSRRREEEEESSAHHRSSPAYSPTAFPFPPPFFEASRQSSASAVDPGQYHKMMGPLHPSHLPPPHASHPHSPQFIHWHNAYDHYPASGTIGPRFNNDVSQTLAPHDIGFRTATKHKEYPAIAAIDPKEAYVAGKTVITRSKWAWRDFPALEAFLVENREDYLQHSAMNYTQEQKEYNSKLTERLLQVADANNYIFHANDFDFVSIRDRIRCYYKSYVQANKKKGKIVSYPKVERTLKAGREEKEEN